MAAVAAVGLRGALAVTGAQGLQLHRQGLLHPHRADVEVLWPRQATGQLQCHVEGHLRGHTVKIRFTFKLKVKLI